MSCLFCSIVAGDIPYHKIYEDESTLAFLDIGPVSTGHTVIIPKAHAENLQAGSIDDAVALMKTIYAIAPAILSGVHADGYNLGMNHGECAGQEILHTHLHLMPRANGIPRTFAKSHPSAESLAATAESIRSFLR